MTDVASEQFEHFLAEAISNSPQPLKDLAGFLAGVLDENQWKTADRLLLALATSTCGTQPGTGEVNQTSSEMDPS